MSRDFFKLEDESSQSFCSAERREVLLVIRPTPTTRFRGLLGDRFRGPHGERTQPEILTCSAKQIRPDRSHLGLGCMARRGRDVPTATVVPSPDAGEHWRVSGRFMRLGAFRIEWESSAAGRVMLRARNSQRPAASTTTRLPALHAFLRADQLQHGLHGPYAIRRGHPAVDGGVSPEQPG